MIEALNHSVRGTRATAETRSAHHRSDPSLAEPSPIARARGERMFLRSTPLRCYQQADDPGRHGEHYAPRHDRPPRNVDRPKFESVHGIPDQMADATAEVQKKGEGGSNQPDLSDPGRDGALDGNVGLRPSRGRHEPNDQPDGADTQKDASDPIENR